MTKQIVESIEGCPKSYELIDTTEIDGSRAQTYKGFVAWNKMDEHEVEVVGYLKYVEYNAAQGNIFSSLNIASKKEVSKAVR